MRVRQCRLSGRRVPGSGFGLWWPALISGLLRLPTAGYVATPNPAKDSCPCASACAFTTTDRALMTRIMWLNPMAGSRTLQMLFPVVHSVSWSGRHNVFANSVMHLMQDKAAAMTTCFADGSPGWIRTSDQPLRRRLLFPLSYRQIWWAVKDSNLPTLPL